jgi:Uma2 family endonuclease
LVNNPPTIDETIGRGSGMATVETGRMTADEFWVWCTRPENQDRFYELDQGEVVEMPSPGELHGVLCSLIAHILWSYVFQRGRGYVCGNDTGLLVQRNPDVIRGPDVMLFDEPRQLDALSKQYATVPKLVVEVLSPNDSQGKVNQRIGQYLRRGVPLVWLLDPEPRIVTVYQPGKELVTCDETEELTGMEILPDLRLRVAELFTLPEGSPGV